MELPSGLHGSEPRARGCHEEEERAAADKRDDTRPFEHKRSRSWSLSDDAHTTSEDSVYKWFKPLCAPQPTCGEERNRQSPLKANETFDRELEEQYASNDITLLIPGALKRAASSVDKRPRRAEMKRREGKNPRVLHRDAGQEPGFDHPTESNPLNSSQESAQVDPVLSSSSLRLLSAAKGCCCGGAALVKMSREALSFSSSVPAVLETDPEDDVRVATGSTGHGRRDELAIDLETALSRPPPLSGVRLITSTTPSVTDSGVKCLWRHTEARRIRLQAAPESVPAPICQLEAGAADPESATRGTG
ncbi:hypothetical protein EYF80_011681 [Liparis tanakae]|uniref:Uncharacterized protein n=1 Tax=Liparis tanakae TaxID=230148 RepID=A0A4Z2IJX8_9TELE|nr:hypothetical protein EYF80_011681 [Liparis tanakae]